MADLFINIKSKNDDMRKSTKKVVSSLKGLSSATNKSTGSFSKFYKQQKKTNKQLQNMTKDANRASKSMLKLKGSVNGLNQVLGSAKIMAFGYFMAKNVNAAMEMIETINLFGVSMGKTTEEANKFVVAISDAFGLDPTNVMNAVGTYNLLATSMGMSAENAYTLSTNTAKLGYDLSSLFNIPIEQVMGDLRSGLVGQSETMYKYGVDVTEASLKQEALNQGIQKSVRNMSQGEKMGLRYSVMLRQTSVAQGDFSRTLEQPANQMKIFTEQVSRLSRTIGTVFIPIMAKVLPYLNAFVSLLIDAISALAAFFGYKAPDFPDVAAGLSGVSAGTDDVNAATSAVKALKNASSGMDELNVIAEPPSAAGGAGGGASVGGGDFDLSGYDNMLDKVKAISDELKGKMLPVLKKIVGIIEAVAVGFIAWKLAIGIVAGVAMLSKITRLFELFKKFGTLTVFTKLASMGAAGGGLATLAGLLNPLGLVLIALGLLAVGVVAYNAFIGESDNPMDILREKLKVMKEETKKATDEFYNLRTATDEAFEKSNDHADQIAILATEFDTLVDANGRVKEGYEGRVAFIANELSTATGIEIELLNGVVVGHEDVIIAIQDAIDMMRVEALMLADKTKYDAAMANIGELEDSYYEASKTVEEALVAVAKADEEYNIGASLKAHDALRDAKQVKTDRKVLLDETLNDINDFTNNSILLYEEGTDAYLKANDLILLSQEDFAKLSKEGREAALAEMELNLDKQLLYYKDFGEESYKTNADAQQKEIDLLSAYLDEGTTVTEDGINKQIDAITGKKTDMDNGWIELYEGVGSAANKEASTAFEGTTEMVNGIIDTVNDGITSLKTLHTQINNILVGMRRPRITGTLSLVPHIVAPKLARGGMLEVGQMFEAGEFGKAEMIGTHNNKTTVMPLENTDFVIAIHDAVFSAMKSSQDTEKSSEKPIIVNLDGEVIYTNQQEVSRNRGINLGLGVFAR